MDPETPPPAPAVVAVVVTCDPGDWFTETLASLRDQDYPNMSVLVVDAGSDVDPTPTVAGVLPTAFVRRLERRVPFGAAANEVLSAVEGASHYLFCHDDVVLEPDALRLMVEEAFRSNAGVACPKYVVWEDPERLISVGLTTDKVGAVRNTVEPGELDQEQHDSVREVLVAPAGAVLVRADLFAALGGYDSIVADHGEDLDLSWRARLAGARVTVVPAARCRHLEAGLSGRRSGGRRDSARIRHAAREAHAHRYRTMLVCYHWYTLVWVLPLALVWALGEALTLAAQGHPGDGGAVVASLWSSLQRPSELLQARRRAQRSRSVTDADLRRLQVRGNARLRLYLSSRIDDVRSGLAELSEDDRPSAALRGGRGLILLTLAIVLIFGTRTLFGGALPQIGSLPDISGGLGHIWSTWWSTWQPTGLGVQAASSPATAVLGVLTTLFFGAVGTLRRVLVLAPLFVGPLGAYRAARPWGSGAARAVAAVFYAAVPLAYNAMAAGHWDGLVVYAAAPWLLSALIRLSAEVPLPHVDRARSAGRILGLGAALALTASVAPSAFYVVLIAAGGLAAGSFLGGRGGGAARFAEVGVAGTFVAFLLLLPWSPSVLASGAALFGPSRGPGARLGLGQILRFHTGPFGNGGWGWLLLAAAALPLLIGRRWRLEWAARLWLTALVFFALAWAGRRGWAPPFPVEVLLAPAAAALSGSAALGVAAFEIDLPGYNLGWRQVAAAGGALALALACVPLLGAAGNGRWRLPSADAASVLSVLPDTRAGHYRVLWVGAPDALPLAGRSWTPGFAYATSDDGMPQLADQWVTGPAGASSVLASALTLASRRLTTKLGHLLAPAGVEFLVVPSRMGPSLSGGGPVPVPAALLAGLPLQTDLQLLNIDPAYTVYRNTAWAPSITLLPPPAVDAAIGSGSGRSRAALVAAQGTDLAGAPPALRRGSLTSAGGRIAGPGTVYVAETRSGAWSLTAGGQRGRREAAFGWAMAFRVGPTPGPVPAHLTAAVSLPLRAGEILDILLWPAVAAVLVEDLRRRRRGPHETVDPAWFEASAPGARRPRRGRHPATSEESEMEEVWSDL